MNEKQARSALDDIIAVLNRNPGNALGAEPMQRFVEQVYIPQKYENGDWRRATGQEAEYLFRRQTTSCADASIRAWSRRDSTGYGWINFAVLRRSHSTLHQERGTDPKIIADQQGPRPRCSPVGSRRLLRGPEAGNGGGAVVGFQRLTVRGIRA